MNHECRVYLVHGTFARGATWTDATGNLWQAIAEKSPHADHQVFTWSGWNSFRARRKASEALIQRLLADQRTYGNKPVILVGHSHGGTVVAKATSDPRVSNMLCGVAFIATPFIVASRGSHPASVLALLLSVLAFMGAIAWPVYSWMTDGWLPQNAERLGFASGFLLLLFVFGSSVLGGLAGGAIGSLISPGIRRLLLDSRLPRRAPCGLPLFFAHSPRDEASAVLGTTTALTRVPISAASTASTASFQGIPYLFGLFVVICLAIGIWLFASSQHALNGRDWVLLLKVLIAGPIALALAAGVVSLLLIGVLWLGAMAIYPMLALPRLFALSFLLEHPIASLFVRFRLVRNPFANSDDVHDRNYSFHYTDRLPLLDHSLYHHKEVQTDLALWIYRVGNKRSVHSSCNI